MSMAAMEASGVDPGVQVARQSQIQVHFTTSIADIELPENKRQLLVPSNIKRYGLSQILNSQSMLDTPTPIPFDFLVNGTFLRSTIDDYLAAQGLSAETTLTLQYVRSLIPPVYQASFEHDDWVSCVDVLSGRTLAGSWSGDKVSAGQARILSGSYDGLLRVWNPSGQAIAVSPSSSAGGHTAGIKSTAFISPTSIASSGLDRTIRVWKYREAEDHFSAEMKPILELYGHKGSVESISVHGPSSKIVSASNDGSIGLWTTRKSSAPPAPVSMMASGPAAKRRKLSTSTSTAQRGPLSLISSHTAPVTSVIFNPVEATTAYSTSLDHTLRTHDLVTSRTIDTRTMSHALLCVTSLEGISSPLLAVGTSARHAALLDPRVDATTTAVMTLRGHVNKISSLNPDPGSVYGLVSGSHDGSCRVWDLRSARAGTPQEGGGRVGESVYVIEREGALGKRPVGGEGLKVLDVRWDQDVGIVSAGEDKRVQINRGRGVTRVEEQR